MSDAPDVTPPDLPPPNVGTWTPDGEVPAEPSEDAILAAIATVYDPEIPVNIYELGLIYTIELDDGGMFCGAGGAYSVTEPELSKEIRDRKVATIRAAAGNGKFVVASANPGCAMHLAAAGLDVRHPAELIEKALP